MSSATQRCTSPTISVLTLCAPWSESSLPSYRWRWPHNTSATSPAELFPTVTIVGLDFVILLRFWVGYPSSAEATALHSRAVAASVSSDYSSTLFWRQISYDGNAVTLVPAAAAAAAAVTGTSLSVVHAAHVNVIHNHTSKRRQHCDNWKCSFRQAIVERSRPICKQSLRWSFHYLFFWVFLFYSFMLKHCKQYSARIVANENVMQVITDLCRWRYT